MTLSAILRHRWIVTAVVVVLGVTAVVWWQVTATAGRQITAEFVRAVGVYVGSDVRVLGVKVGEITKVEPDGEVVRVTLVVDDEYDIPADATAIVIPPSVVADRYIQLSPAYTGGPTLPDGANLGPRNTVVPMELDEVYASLDEFAAALGENGDLAELIEVARDNLEGNGEALGQSLDDLAEVTEVLNGNRDDLWTTVDNLADFTSALAESDAQMELFNDQLADVSTQLADERDTLGQAITQLTIALRDISGFIDDNADQLVSNVEELAQLSGVFAKQQEALITILDYAPVALTNLDLAYNARSGTLDTRDDVLGQYDPASFLCAQLAHAVGIESVPQACIDLANALSASDLPMPPELLDLVGLVPGVNP
ncbi:virulence factor Mce-like protein [Stackebrandtia endophytica]|uniref:Virulence factor Mce-like protein n=1 Tax=Stackebrandtia endophytica TaxID=1496996 RepID=A0A543AZQ5_9ACTN|nr:MCE family protein [Stackebrandtia endophytica]TQL78051.1 virulence factor Mce-like protein [Stackebrandtia endophytica]